VTQKVVTVFGRVSDGRSSAPESSSCKIVVWNGTEQLNYRGARSAATVACFDVMAEVGRCQHAAIFNIKTTNLYL